MFSMLKLPQKTVGLPQMQPILITRGACVVVVIIDLELNSSKHYL